MHHIFELRELRYLHDNRVLLLRWLGRLRLRRLLLLLLLAMLLTLKLKLLRRTLGDPSLVKCRMLHSHLWQADLVLLVVRR